jgi:hypothetical protein
MPYRFAMAQLVRGREPLGFVSGTEIRYLKPFFPDLLVDAQRRSAGKESACQTEEYGRPARVRLVELTAKGRALITKIFRKHVTAMEEAAGVLSKKERPILLRLLKKLGKGRKHES